MPSPTTHRAPPRPPPAHPEQLPEYLREAQDRTRALLLRWTPLARERFVYLDPVAWHNTVEFVESVFPESDIDPYEFWLTLEFTYRARNTISALEVREAVRALGDQADIYIKKWVEQLRDGAYSPSSFSLSLRVWQNEMMLSQDGADVLRQVQGVPAPPSRAAVIGLLNEFDEASMAQARGKATGGRAVSAN